MSPQLLAMLQSVDRNCRRTLAQPDVMGARYPRDYFRPCDAVWRNGTWVLRLHNPRV